MDHRGLFLLAMLLVTAVPVSGQNTEPTPFRFDCRRTNVDCQNSGLCLINNGTCDCTDTSFEGHNCDLSPTLKTTCAESQCENNGVCLTEDRCSCNSNTYGAKCENPRVKMWCQDTKMFININPHTSDFAGRIYLRKGTDDDGKNDANCFLTAVDNAQNVPDLAAFDFVRTVNGEVPTLEGFFIAPDHMPAEGSVFCQAASKTNVTDRIDYIQQVVIEYNTLMVSSLDQIVTFNCSISTTAGDTPFTSENALNVAIDNDDLIPLNVTGNIIPVLLEIVNPETLKIVTNDVNLGDALNLVFTLQTLTAGEEVTNSTITQFKVTECEATNGQPGVGDAPPPNIIFLENDCPKNGSEMLYRGLVVQEDDRTQTTIPIMAFRFVGNLDSVTISCTIKLCTQAMVLDDENACMKTPCPGDTPKVADGGEGGDEGENGGENPNAGGGGENPNAGGGGENPNAGGGGENPNAGGGENPASGGVRRKREATEDFAKVNKSINVKSPLDTGSQTGSDDGRDDDATKEKNTEDCMQHSEVLIIIAIFAVIFVILLVALVASVVNLLRSRQKVVGVPSNLSATTDTHSHYTLPRLSLNTTM